MDTERNLDPASISATHLASQLGRADAPLILDVRKDAAYNSAERLIAGALRVPADEVESSSARLPRDRPVVVYCVHGHEVSQGAARSLRDAGIDAVYLEGGSSGWTQAGLPTMSKQPELGLPASLAKPSRWITRARPKVDRIACPWLVRRFLDPGAVFLYVPAAEVIATGKRENAVPYDVPDVRIAHRGAHGERCSFDALVDDCGLDHAPLHELARIVRGADTGKPDLTPESAGLLAVSQGLSSNFPDDHAMLEAGMTLYDALYAWTRRERP